MCRVARLHNTLRWRATASHLTTLILTEINWRRRLLIRAFARSNISETISNGQLGHFQGSMSLVYDGSCGVRRAKPRQQQTRRKNHRLNRRRQYRPLWKTKTRKKTVIRDWGAELALKRRDLYYFIVCCYRLSTFLSIPNRWMSTKILTSSLDDVAQKPWYWVCTFPNACHTTSRPLSASPCIHLPRLGSSISGNLPVLGNTSENVAARFTVCPYIRVSTGDQIASPL